MNTPTYEITTGAADGSPQLNCLLCGAVSSDAENVSRLYCDQCSWFHEPLDARTVEMENAIRRATGEVATALELAESSGESVAAVPHLKQALRLLRLSLTRA